MRTRPLRLALSLAALLWLAGCTIMQPSADKRLTLFVGPQTVPCTGVGPQQCLLVRENAQVEWSYFYQSIEGFTHEPGYLFTLHVARQRAAVIAADASSYEYRLIEVLDRMPSEWPPVTTN